ncbi:MAG: hypothetical protein RL722_1524 [Pseudomonadota bacterium]|jgi:hypothetical protein
MNQNNAIQDEPSRLQLATRIHDLLLNELGQDVDIALLLGPPEYARAVLSLCRACGSATLVRLAQHFERSSHAEVKHERLSQQQRLGSGALKMAAAYSRAGSPSTLHAHI